MQGFQVNTHCIGDKANHLIINTYEKCFKDYILSKQNGQNITEKELTKEVKKLGESVRFRIEHAQILVCLLINICSEKIITICY